MHGETAIVDADKGKGKGALVQEYQPINAGGATACIGSAAPNLLTNRKTMVQPTAGSGGFQPFTSNIAARAWSDVPSPYEEAISVIGRTLSAFDDDGLIPCYGFGDTTTGDQSVFSFLAGDQPCRGLEQAIQRLGLLGRASGVPARPSTRTNPPLDPPVPPELLRGSHGPAAAGPPKGKPASARTSGCGGAGGSCSGAAPAAAAAPASGAAPPDPMFLCPITQDVMTDPVIATDGYTYERAAIVDWLARKATSPLTNQRLPAGNALIPNHGLRSAIMEWKQKRTGA
ncbi:E3 ubiquitin-protein ligase [Tetrabaena socialis]|uniref:E3 ubiquitin-protein ligase n=1 Tax=Tetrabaena socialis TaxID=47790 RepID=A0A2J8A492_9CHLO|nr:E3 ubiquitin-protein ligase [Tetrabaena socialis]|eukprot:PNH07323.1 E3 ubiquitin-protein ligase [Tetrabaena socialis]